MIRTHRFAAKASPPTHKRFDELSSERHFLWNAARRECKTAHEAASTAAAAQGLKKGSEERRNAMKINKSLAGVLPGAAP